MVRTASFLWDCWRRCSLSWQALATVFDIESEEPAKDFDHFCGVLEAIEENSPDARIFVLVHKMDLVADEDRELILEERKRLIAESCISCGVENFQCYGTSIWDETLYKAWSDIVTSLIPNIGLLETQLINFCRLCDADEVVLFERATFLVISHAQASDDDDGTDANDPADPMALPRHVKRTPHFDAHRFEKVSNIVKQFKLSCGKAQSQFQGMEVGNSRFRAFIDGFTTNTYIMVIVSNPSVHTAATLLNIQNARNHFEQFIPRI